MDNIRAHMTSPPAGRVTKGERTREAIMTAAAELFRERGFRETSLSDIGAAAGVSGPAIYRYFKSKGELLSVLIEEAAILWRGTVDDVLNEDTPPRVTLERLIDAAITLQLRNGNLRDVFNKEYRSLGEDARRRVAPDRARADGGMDAPPLRGETRTERPGRSGCGDHGRRDAPFDHHLDRCRSGAASASDEGHGARWPAIRRGRTPGGGAGMSTAPESAARTPASAAISEESQLDEESFRHEVLAFLEATLTRKGARREDGGVTEHVGGDQSGVTRAVAYQHTLAEAHLAGITWPVAYGGRGLSGRFQRIFDREAKGFVVPPRSLEIGLGMCGPTLLVHATEEQKQEFIPPLLRGDHVWCELFSEPGAGSDLSSVQTTARRDGEEFVLDGQKVWTSGAQYSDFAACLARTDPARPKREGITMFVVDMHTPGITVRPLRQLTGESHFNEVFLDAVRVPVSNILGHEHDGWRVARTMLAFERQALGGLGSSGGGKGGFARLAELAAQRGLADRPVVRDHLAQLRIHQMVLRHLSGYLQATSRGSDGAAASMLKLAMAHVVQDTARAAVEVAGMHAVAWDPADPQGGRWSDQLLSSLSASIGGGTNEIVRNVIAERVLGLPRDEEGDLMPGDLLGDARTGATRGS